MLVTGNSTGRKILFRCRPQANSVPARDFGGGGGFCTGGGVPGGDSAKSSAEPSSTVEATVVAPAAGQGRRLGGRYVESFDDSAIQQVINGGPELIRGKIEIIGECGEKLPAFCRQLWIFQDDRRGTLQEELDLPLFSGLQCSRRWFGRRHSTRCCSSANLPRHAGGPNSGNSSRY